jgi:transcription elongation factor GreA
MPPKQKPSSKNPGFSMGEAATHYFSSLPPDTAAPAQQEVFKFIRWYGEERPVVNLTGQEVANYAEQFGIATTKSAEHLHAVKTFLSFAHKQGVISTNLSAHIRVKKPAARRLAASSLKAEDPIMLTKNGYDEMKSKLVSLKEERPRVTEEIRKAAADKDFRENAPLQAAREKQGHIEGQIRDLEETLKKARVLESDDKTGLRIAMGDTATIADTISGEKINYTIVSSQEANIKQHKISLASPMGQAIFNKEAGDLLEVNAPSGVLTYKIIEITRH